MPDPSFEMYYGLPFQPPEAQQPGHGGPATEAEGGMRIRGRGLGVEDDDDDDDDEGEDEWMSDGPVDGTSFCSDSLLPDAPDLEADVGGEGGREVKLRGGAGGAGGGGGSDAVGPVYVTSFSGVVCCRTMDAGELYAAIDAVLVLKRRAGVKISVGVVRARSDAQQAEVVGLERVELGNESSEKEGHGRLVKAYRQAQQEAREGSWLLSFFACHRSSERALVELQDGAASGKTNCVPGVSAETFLFCRVLDRVEWQNTAYLWMPQGVSGEIASSVYAAWFRNVVRIVSGPQEARDNQAGRQSAQLPKEPCLVTVEVEVGQGTPFHCESPVPREVWEAIVTRGRGGNNMFRVTLTPLAGKAFVQVPGYHPEQPTAGPDLGVGKVLELAWSSVPEHDRASVSHMLARRPRHSETVKLPCRNGQVDRTAPGYQAQEARLRDWLGHNLFLTIAPQWQTYRAFTTEGGHIDLPACEDWLRVRSQILHAFKAAGPDAEHTHVLRIDQRTAPGTGPLHKNRVVSHLSLGTGDRAHADWSEFRAALSVKDFTIALVPKPLDLDLDLDHQHAASLWDRWGCNRPPPPPPAPARSPPPPPPPSAPIVANGHHPGPDQGLLHQGVPQLGPGVDMFQSGKHYREQSFATPLSVQVADQKPRFPINAPPIELIRRPRGPGGIESDSMPVVSTHVMTPTEQRSLQQAFFQMRSIALNRAQQCPHEGCSAFFPVGPDNMAAFHKHLADRHVASHCPFCDHSLFQHWSPEQKQRHFVDHHSEYFTAPGDLQREALLAASTTSRGNVHRREEQYNFCPRCGRNHQLLTSVPDRVHHDNACFPGNAPLLQPEKYCPRCGEPDYALVGRGATRRRQQHQCAPADPASGTFCRHCALDCQQLPVSYARRHLLNCKPLASAPDSWCPWCGVDLGSGPQSSRLKHLALCALRPASGQNPVCTDSGIPLDSPRDLQAHRLRHGLTDMGTVDRSTRIAVPPTCPVAHCAADLTSWNAQGLYDHFQSHPENALEPGGGLKSCPFCKCNFETRGWATRLEKQQHLDDHIHFKQRARRVLNDEIIGSHPDRDSAPVLQALSTLDYDQLGNTAETESLNAEIARLSETVKRLAEENRRCRDAQRQGSSGTCGSPPSLPTPPPPLFSRPRCSAGLSPLQPHSPLAPFRSASEVPARS